MLHTVVPLDLVFAADLPETTEELCGSARLVWQTANGERKLMRVISTDLKDYLRYRM